jgi:rubrerythrin
MKSRFSFTILSTLLVVIALFTSSYAQKPAASEKALGGIAATAPLSGTLDNLQTAYYDERNTHAQYVAYAQKADEEGYHQVASMFRAIARGEEVHAANHAAVIQHMGAVPTSLVDPPIVRTTRENVQSAAEEEKYDQTVMYPEYIQVARNEHNDAAVQTLSYANAAESSHLGIYRQALNDLEAYRGENIKFLVCPGCGRVVRSLVDSKCPVCSTPREKLEAIH